MDSELNSTTQKFDFNIPFLKIKIIPWILACIRKMRDKKFLHVALALLNYVVEKIF